MISYVRVCFVLVWPYFHMFACTYMCFNGLNFILSYWLTIECLSSIQTSKNTFILLFTEKYYELSLASNCYRTQKNLCVGNIRMFCMSLYVCVCVCVPILPTRALPKLRDKFKIGPVGPSLARATRVITPKRALWVRVTDPDPYLKK